MRWCRDGCCHRSSLVPGLDFGLFDRAAADALWSLCLDVLSLIAIVVWRYASPCSACNMSRSPLSGFVSSEVWINRARVAGFHYIVHLVDPPSSSIGGLVVKLAVAIRISSSDNVGQPRVRFPADALNPALRNTSFCQSELRSVRIDNPFALEL